MPLIVGVPKHGAQMLFLLSSANFNSFSGQLTESLFKNNVQVTFCRSSTGEHQLKSIVRAEIHFLRGKKANEGLSKKINVFVSQYFLYRKTVSRLRKKQPS